jgi:hypothetical protein
MDSFYSATIAEILTLPEERPAKNTKCYSVSVGKQQASVINNGIVSKD